MTLDNSNSLGHRWFAISRWLHTGVAIEPLALFRIVFGLLMLGSAIRFWYLGWIEDHYIQSKVQFKYYGFEWVQLLPPAGMYALQIAMIVGSIGILLGWRYRWSAIVFFLSFTYLQLIDLTYYLNHYYFVSLVSLLLVFLPANTRYSLDVLRNPTLLQTEVPRWTIFILQFQVALVYVFAGLAKINYTWLIEAMPLRIWLPANDALPIIGPLFKLSFLPWVFSWAGMLYDCTIVFWLTRASTRWWAYAAVVVFHTLTGCMFQIGVFPVVMIGATLIFFPPEWHKKVLNLRFWPGMATRLERWSRGATPIAYSPRNRTWVTALIGVYIIGQVLFPLRSVLYPGNLFWTEEGYRFSWRVMLMEKAGTAIFYVKDKRSGREGVVNNSDFLCAHQEKQMSMQPDMILQFAHFLQQHYAANGVYEPAVRAEVYVTLNAQPSRLLFDPMLDLTQIQDSWQPKTWLYAQ